MNIGKWLLVISLSLVIGACAVNSSLESTAMQPLKPSDHYSDGIFHNTTDTAAPTFRKMMQILKRWMTEKGIDKQPNKPLPMKMVSRTQLEALSDTELHLVKLGHSSILMKVYGDYWLIDPVFSERASPFGFMGPKRFQPTPIAIKDLPPITKVLISHNHYDHLDAAAIKDLAATTKQFLVPLGLEGDLQKWGVEPAKITRFDWWQELKTDNALLAFTPTQHFSGRGLSDRNTTLWGSWVVKVAGRSLYFSGDSGYFDGFKTIGEKYGPFDLTLIETGAYNKDWPDIHMWPEESVQAHIDLKGGTLLPIHNATFDLSFHAWYDPLERVSKAAEARGVRLSAPVTGEVFTVQQAAFTEKWWRDYQ